MLEYKLKKVISVTVAFYMTVSLRMYIFKIAVIHLVKKQGGFLLCICCIPIKVLERIANPSVVYSACRFESCVQRLLCSRVFIGGVALVK